MRMSSHLVASLAALALGCSNKPDAPTPAPAATAAPAAPTPAPPPAAPAPAPAFAEPTPAGWSTKAIERDGRRLVVALAGQRSKPDDPDSRPDGRLSLLEGDKVIAQRPLGALLAIPDGEEWYLDLTEAEVGGRRLVTLSVMGATGEDYKEVVDIIALFAADPLGIEPLWTGPGGTTASSMGVCLTGVRQGLAVEGQTLVIRYTAIGRWVGDTPEEDWEKEIFADCKPPKTTPPAVRVALPPPG